MAAPASFRTLSRHVHATARASLLAALVFIGGAAHAAKWDPINPADLADAKPQVDPEAGAEILLKTVSMDQRSISETFIHHHVRAKIYDQRGVDEFLKIDLHDPFLGEITDVSARTIAPDGTIVELGKADIRVRDGVRVRGLRQKITSFAMANLKPGSFVEYRYTEEYTSSLLGLHLFFQSEFPARIVRFRYRQDIQFLIPIYINTIFFGPKVEPKKVSGGYTQLEMTNVPARTREPNQLPRLNAEHALILSYRFDEPEKDAAKEWPRLAEKFHDRQVEETAATSLIKKTAAGLIAGEDTDEAKLRKIYDFCRGKIRNRRITFARATREERKRMTFLETAHDTLKAREGWNSDITMLFIALARAAKIDARLAYANDRSYVIFSPDIREPFMLSDPIAAVKVGERWMWFDPGTTYLPFGEVAWFNTSTYALIADPKTSAGPTLIPQPAPALSKRKRQARLTLDAEGTLEGEVETTFTGHHEAVVKYELEDLTPKEREEFFADPVRKNLPLAEITELKIEGADDPLAPLRVTYRLRVPEYAERTGSRIFFQPAVFQKNQPVPYPDEQRTHPLLYRFPNIEQDSIRITPPAGYELEEASAPHEVPFGQVATYAINIGVGKQTGVIIYDRSFTLKALLIPPKFYTPVREAFHLVHKRDAHTLTLRKKPGATEPVVTSTPKEPVASAAPVTATPSP